MLALAQTQYSLKVKRQHNETTWWGDDYLIVVRKIRLIQPMVIILEGGVKMVMVSFANSNYVNVRGNYMQVYNKQYKDICI